MGLESRPAGGAWRRHLPRPETIFLFLGLLWTALAKSFILRRLGGEHILRAGVETTLADLAFFSACGLVFAILYMLGRPRLVARVTMLAGGVILLWAVLNSAWLFATGVQLLPGVVGVLVLNCRELIPLVITHIERRLVYGVPLIVTAIAALVWFCWRLAKPIPVPDDPGRVRAGILAPAALLALAMVAMVIAPPLSSLGYRREVLGYSSHWCAVRDLFRPSRRASDVAGPGRDLPRVGERSLSVPATPREALPNVVVILLESVSYKAAAVNGTPLARTPTLRHLAEEGVEFVTTRVPVSDTSKAFWATFTGSTPDIQSDTAEAVLADEPYESLASILGRVGYRAGFFEMSRGEFECAPGLFFNLDFDWAWCRENLEDPAAHLGYMNGDDHRLIGPAVEWAASGREPFVLAMITSVAHHPYEVPAWFATPRPDSYEGYLQSVEYSDAFVRDMMAALEERGLMNNTLVCVLGDHGVDFRPDSPASRWRPYDELIRVPWIIRWPGHVEPGRRVEGTCSQLDVTPTILSILGFDVTRADFDGRNALDPVPPDRRLYFATWYADSPRGFVEGRRKVIYEPYVGSVFEFDLEQDPAEQNAVRLDGESAARCIADIEEWERASRFFIPATRFREKFVYEHWQIFCTGRYPRGIYVP